MGHFKTRDYKRSTTTTTSVLLTLLTLLPWTNAQHTQKITAATTKTKKNHKQKSIGKQKLLSWKNECLPIKTNILD